MQSMFVRGSAFLRVASAAIACTVLSCAAARPVQLGERSQDGKAEGAKACEKVLSQFVEALNTCDLQRTMALFSQDATGFLPFADHPERFESRESLTKALGEFYETMRSQATGPRFMNIVPQDVSTQVYGNEAVVSFLVRSGPVTSRRTMVLRKEGGRWEICHLHASNIRTE
jgi:ketosteroid isomerase-like protein